MHARSRCDLPGRSPTRSRVEAAAKFRSSDRNPVAFRRVEAPMLISHARTLIRGCFRPWPSEAKSLESHSRANSRKVV